MAEQCPVRGVADDQEVIGAVLGADSAVIAEVGVILQDQRIGRGVQAEILGKKSEQDREHHHGQDRQDRMAQDQPLIELF